jgi:uncharacterized protein YdeI (BOF family)
LRKEKAMQVTNQWIEEQIRSYTEQFLKTEYGPKTASRFKNLRINAVNAYDQGGVSEASENSITLAAKRDFDAGKLTNTTKLILRHELGHLIDEDSFEFPDYDGQIHREKKAWHNAKLKNAAERWYKNISVRTHTDPLKMAAVGFPRPETKIPKELLCRGTEAEVSRMKAVSSWVDVNLAKRFALSNLVGNPNYYS